MIYVITQRASLYREFCVSRNLHPRRDCRLVTTREGARGIHAGEKADRVVAIGDWWVSRRCDDAVREFELCGFEVDRYAPIIGSPTTPDFEVDMNALIEGLNENGIPVSPAMADQIHAARDRQQMRKAKE